jgi:hypothetical protein
MALSSSVESLDDKAVNHVFIGCIGRDPFSSVGCRSISSTTCVTTITVITSVLTARRFISSGLVKYWRNKCSSAFILSSHNCQLPLSHSLIEMLAFQDFSTLLHSLGLIQGLKPIIIANLTASAGTSDYGPVNISLSASTSNHDPLDMHEYQDVEPLSPLPSTHWLATAANMSCDVLPWEPLGPLDTSFPPWDPAVANLYRYRKQQSVNLGSWYVYPIVNPNMLSINS